MDKDFLKSCPQNEDFVRIFLGEADLDEKEALIKHTLLCKECNLKLDVLRQLRRKLKTRVGSVQDELFPSEAADLFIKAANLCLEKEKKGKSVFSLLFKYAPVKLALVASVLLIIATTGFFLLIQKSPKAELIRGEAGQKLTLIEPLGKISRPPLYFRWTELKGQDYYWFRLIDDSLNTLAGADVRNGNVYTLPPLIRDQLKKNTTYIWSVEAIDDNNKILDVRSGHFSIEK